MRILALQTAAMATVLGAATQPAVAIVIDDFSVGAASVVGPATVNQTGLDPLHVIGGARQINVERSTSTWTIKPEGGFRFESTDWGYFSMQYGAVEPLAAIDLTQEGHDRVLVRFGAVDAGFHPFGLFLSSTNSTAAYGQTIYVFDAWDDIVLEVPFTRNAADETSVDRISIDVFRNPRDTAFEIESIVTGRRGPLGDFNYDGLVDVADYDVWSRTFAVHTGSGLSASYVASADANEDGRVDGGDFLTWQRAWPCP